VTLDTHPYRVDIGVYSHLHGLAEEEGADPSLHGPLGVPYRDWLRRVQTHMTHFRKGGKLLYPKVRVTGELDAATRAALESTRPKRPTFEAAFRQIAYLDDTRDGEEYYTQGPLRWQGVRAVYGKVKTQKPPALKAGDCSAGYTRWVLWALEQSTGRIPHDIVNGLSWRAGYTGTISQVCKKVAVPQVGDAILYGSGTYEHVTGVYDVQDQTCISHGRARAEIVSWDRHADRAGFWRPDYSKIA
jgi:hypothetical protein